VEKRDSKTLSGEVKFQERKSILRQDYHQGHWKGQDSGH